MEFRGKFKHYYVNIGFMLKEIENIINYCSFAAYFCECCKRIAGVTSIQTHSEF